MLCKIAKHLAATVPDDILGTLGKDDDDGNENAKKAKSLITKTTRLHVHHTFLYISSPSLHDYDLKMLNFTFYATYKRTQHCWTTSTITVGCSHVASVSGSEINFLIRAPTGDQV